MPPLPFPVKRATFPPFCVLPSAWCPPAVDTGFFSPEQAAPLVSEGVDLSQAAELVSIDMKGLPDTAPVHPVLAQLLPRRPGCHVLLTGCDYAGMARNMGTFIDIACACPGRLHIRGMLGRAEYRNMLAASTVHVAPSPFHRLRNLLEAMSCGAMLLAHPASLAGSAALIPGETMQVWPEAPEEQLRLLLHALDNGEEREKLRRTGQQAVRTTHAQSIILSRHADDLLLAHERWKAAAHA